MPQYHLYLCGTDFPMAKPTMLITLLSLWLIAIIGLPVITLVRVDSKSIVVNPLNEEDHPDQGKKDTSQNQIIAGNIIAPILSWSLNGTAGHDLYIPGKSNYIMEILAPPPKSTS